MVGLRKVHTGCKNCYAETWSNRKMHDATNLWGEDAPRRVIKSAFTDLHKYQNRAAKDNSKLVIFMGSMMDIFEDSKPTINLKGEPLDFEMDGYSGTSWLRYDLFTRINAGMYPDLIFLFLTKRPENINKYIFSNWKEKAPSNVWFGTSCSDQETANKYIPRLLKVKGNKFLSIEPQTGEIDLYRIDADLGGDKQWCMINCLNGKQTDMGRPCEQIPTIDWVIQGGESGPKKRPFNINWAENMVDQCQLTDVPYFFKQIDKIQTIPKHLNIKELPKF